MGLKSGPLLNITKKIDLPFSICSERTFPKSNICMGEVVQLNLCTLKNSLI